MIHFIKGFIKPRLITVVVWMSALGGLLSWLAYQGQLASLLKFLDSKEMSLNLGESSYSVLWALKALAIIVVLIWVAGLVNHIGEKKIRSFRKLGVGSRALLAKAFQVTTYFITFLIGTQMLGINLAALTVLGGTIGIGIGFGLQKITSNFISGLIILFERTLKQGDLVELNGGLLGVVKQTYARYSLIEMLDGKEVMVPNEDFITNQVTNLSYSDTKGRIDVRVGVSYESDVERAREILLEVAKEHPRCLKTPAPNCYLTEFADSSINLLLHFWIADITEDRLTPRSDVMRSIRKKFNEEGIAIPFPQRDVHIVSHIKNCD